MRYETYVNLAQIPTPTPSPSGTSACDKSDDVCRWILDKTDNTLLASGSYYVLVKPLRILLIIVIALAARYALHRLISRLVRRTTEGTVPAILRPLKERLPAGLQVATAIFAERRRQRAEAIGSVLRSTATAVVYSIAALMILSELGIDLAPLLGPVGTDLFMPADKATLEGSRPDHIGSHHSQSGIDISRVEGRICRAKDVDVRGRLVWHE